MGQPEIFSKLAQALDEDITTEAQVVYILSRLRKYLEITGQKKTYKDLNFYCNWALHSKLERTEPVADALREFLQGTDGGKFLSFDYLIEDLKKFIDKHGLPRKILEDNANFLRFINLLVGIYSDTPLTVTPEDTRTITIEKPDAMLDKYPFALSYKIS